MPAVLNGGRGDNFRVSRFSTFFRTLPIFFTAFLTAGADLPVFFASLRDRRSLFLRPQHPRAGRLASGRHHVVLAGRDRSAGDPLLGEIPDGVGWIGIALVSAGVAFASAGPR
jgi:drug/metabolite transporter (DMT)-like permease